MKILAIEKSLKEVAWEKETETLQREAGAVYELYLSEVVREIYFTRKKNAVLILETENLETADKILRTLPLAKKGLIGFELMELRPYSGYQRIMKEL